MSIGTPEEGSVEQKDTASIRLSEAEIVVFLHSWPAGKHREQQAGGNRQDGSGLSIASTASENRLFRYNFPIGLWCQREHGSSSETAACGRCAIKHALTKHQS